MIETRNENIENREATSINSEIYSDEMINILSSPESLEMEKFCDLLINRHTQDLSALSPEHQYSFLKDRALYILPEEDLFKKLDTSQKEQKPLTVKFGIDPTGAQVHMGHAVPIVMLNRLQRMGHNIVFVIGDFTAKIGDPTGRSSERPPLTDEQIQQNLSTYREQVSPFFDMSKSKVVYNGERLRDLTLNELLKTLSSVNVSRILQRDDFRKRLENNQGLAMSEMLYPIVM